MSERVRLFMVLLGSKPDGRHTEQHDVFFSVSHSLKELVPEIKAFWPGAKSLHIDGWREVNWVDGYKIEVRKKEGRQAASEEEPKIFFINLGGYRKTSLRNFIIKCWP